MRTEKTERNREKDTSLPDGKWGEILVNLFGFLLAFAIVFGGMFWVKDRLAWEEARLLQGSGTVLVLDESNMVEGQGSSAEDAGKTRLAEDELLQVVQKLESGTQSYPSEPQQGQLSMTEAIAFAGTWMENFCMPYLGVPGFSLKESKVNCYLRTLQENEESNIAAKRQFGYWTVEFSTEGMEAELLLHAVSGQVLDASFSCTIPTACQNQGEWTAFLENYADSFDLEDKEAADENSAPEDVSGTMYKSVGSKGIYAALRQGRLKVNRVDADSGTVEHMETINIRIYLTSGRN